MNSDDAPEYYHNSSDEGLGETKANAPSSETIQLSTWQPKGQRMNESDTVQRLRIAAGETLTLIGQYDLFVETGTIQIYGATLISGPRCSHRVFAPATHALPQISGLAQISDIEIRHCDHSIRPLARISPLFRRLWNSSKRDSVLNLRGASFLATNTDDPSKRILQPLKISIQWKQRLRMIVDPKASRMPKVLVCGPKGSGKSTFSRVLLNHMLTFPVSNPETPTKYNSFAETVCWLDIDPGQPEFTPPGQISLLQIRRPMFGPPFSHPYADASTPVRAIRAHSIAAVSPKDDPEQFLACALDLLHHYHKILERFPMCPLIINCPGWVLGSALEIMTQLMRSTKMTDVVYMSEAGMTQVVDTLRSAAGDANFHRFSSEFLVLPGRTAAELRTMQYQSYFHQHEPDHNNPRWTVSSFTDKSPTIFRYAASEADFLGIMTLGEQPTDEFLATVLDGTFVALVEIEDEQYASTLQQKLVRSTNENLPYWPPDDSGLVVPPDPSKTHMIALALVVRIDVDKKELVLRTPLPSTHLQNIRYRQPLASAKSNSSRSPNRAAAAHVPRVMLVRGRYDTPGWAYQEELFRSMGCKANSKKSGKAAAKREQEDEDEYEEEDLSIGDVGFLPDVDVADGDDDDNEAENDDEGDVAVDIPWIKKLEHGKAADKRWRVRRDMRRRG